MLIFPAIIRLRELNSREEEEEEEDHLCTFAVRLRREARNNRNINCLTY